MGVYNEVKVPCPKCGRKEYFQSKSGECVLDTYEFGQAPDEVMADVNRHAPYTCQDCGTAFRVEIKATYSVVEVPQ
jgi:predicted RNA-binding Zn-ribbon protein involved in translation (DUF1610 family)